MSTEDNNTKENGNPDSDFIGVERITTKRFYLGGVKQGVNTEKIKAYMTERGVVPSVVRVITSNRKGTVAVKFSVLTKDSKAVSINEFWPANVYVRPWLSVDKWSEKLKDREQIKK